MISLSRENNIYFLEEMMCLAASCSGLLYSLTEFDQKQQITRTTKERREKKEVKKEENRREKWLNKEEEIKETIKKTTFLTPARS